MKETTPDKPYTPGKTPYAPIATTTRPQPYTPEYITTATPYTYAPARTTDYTPTNYTPKQTLPYIPTKTPYKPMAKTPYTAYPTPQTPYIPRPPNYQPPYQPPYVPPYQPPYAPPYQPPQPPPYGPPYKPPTQIPPEVQIPMLPTEERELKKGYDLYIQKNDGSSQYIDTYKSTTDAEDTAQTLANTGLAKNYLIKPRILSPSEQLKTSTRRQTHRSQYAYDNIRKIQAWKGHNTQGHNKMLNKFMRRSY